MRLGAVLPIEVHTQPPPASVVTDSAHRLVDAGFESIWTFDCIGRGELVPDPLTLLSVCAAVTDDVDLGIGVLVPPLRNTVELAHRIFTSQMVCGERLLLGVGFGSTKVDYDAVGGDFKRRSQAFEEELPKLRTLLETGRLGEIDLSPWPLGMFPPKIMLGTWGKKVTVAARDYDGWIASAHYRNDKQLATAIKRYRAAGGKRAIAMNLGIPSGDLDRLAIRIEHLAEAGFDEAVVVFDEATPEAMRQVRAIIPI